MNIDYQGASMPLTMQAAEPAVVAIEELERRVSQLEQQLNGKGTAALPSMTEAIQGLRDLFEYAVLRPVDMVKLEGYPYFFYTKDLLYTLFAEHLPETF